MRLLSRPIEPRVIGAAIAAIAVAVLGALNDLFAGPGYELALAAGLIVPSITAVVTALELSKRARAPLDMLGRGIENGALLAFVAYAVAFLHGARTGFCDLAAGTMLYALGPAVGSLLAGVWGAIVSEPARTARRRRTVATVLALGVTLGSALVQVAIFYNTPMVFAFDPFVGYFSGALYDTVLSSEELVSYRVATAASLFAVYVATRQLERRDERIQLRTIERPGLLAIGAIAAVGSLASVVDGHELGHWQTRATIAEELGGHLVEGGCDVIYDIDLDADHVQRFARDCDAHVRDVREWLDIGDGGPVTVYLFADRGQKRYYMGAGRVSVAKPWRREIYLHDEEYPHRVVRHELVHALASDIGAGPFRVAGGVLPNPGLVEGLAEAAAPRKDNLGGHEWAAAMKAIDVLPRTHELFGLAFFGRASSAGYTAAGSFVSHVREEHGQDAIKRWYGGEDITAITGKSWDELERGWHARLDAIALTDAARVTAELRFDRPSVFDRRCPHEVDELLDRGLGRIGGDDAEALSLLDRVLELDPGNVRALMGKARCRDAQGQPEAAQQAYEVVENAETASKLQQLSAREKRGDLALRAGRASEARSLYTPLLTMLTSEGRKRTLELKLHYADDPLARAAFVALLIGTDHRGADNVEALDRLGQWRAAAPDDGTPLYLFGRQHFNRKNYRLAIERFDGALAAGMPVARAVSETLRLKMIAECAIGDHEAAKLTLASYGAHPAVTPHRRRLADALVARCATR